MFCASHPQIHIIELSIKYPKLGVFCPGIAKFGEEIKSQDGNSNTRTKKSMDQTGFVA
jgi:hypothetical protein